MKKWYYWVPLILVIGGVVNGVLFLGKTPHFKSSIPFLPSIKVPVITCPIDKDDDGLNDLEDIVAGAKAEVERQPQYRSAYYQKGYPPESEGVCTDVVWRAFRDAGYDLKGLVDQDIRANFGKYSRIEGRADPNIDFRRVPNLIVFFRRNAQELTLEVKPEDVENLTLWQAGDIVTYGPPHEHIAIVSDKRRPDGVPYILHNSGPTPKESDQLQSWPSQMTGHFRFPRF
ncbi:DUF1287 domain-containing protein [Desulfosporosinus nitroreducens]|uniref:DUF1287 domain-containing protein n=1 Tax=Desulfosporosinus nitroreducens TaxID=2018668 RepID=A0ABT8QK46_9FIRM|nr:DUF1287 domain-containing protein [Desulfosporosinus nitroreducens]MCO1601190.1 DUF1287 domain-containing protein [Desulfosporosinus nitroreducens]MDO0821694.1 DUF1287 domain-containing protein [Desulfosporosinus nitroreducens]